MKKNSYGSATSLVLSPIFVQGILLQPGHLVKLEKDAAGTIIGVQPLRSTMFMFSEDEAADAFGWQYQETIKILKKKFITPLTGLNRTVSS